jgi:catechol 2,3-dioxygenase-like lactoylglutathione lyase family enzyme
MAVPPIAPFGVHHLAVQCRDLAAMVAFYERALRLKIERRWPASEPGLDRSVWLRAGTTVLALEHCSGSAGGAKPFGDAGQPEPPPWQSDRAGLHLLALEVCPVDKDRSPVNRRRENDDRGQDQDSCSSADVEEYRLQCRSVQQPTQNRGRANSHRPRASSSGNEKRFAGVRILLSFRLRH